MPNVVRDDGRAASSIPRDEAVEPHSCSKNKVLYWTGNSMLAIILAYANTFGRLTPRVRPTAATARRFCFTFAASCCEALRSPFWNDSRAFSVLRACLRSSLSALRSTPAARSAFSFSLIYAAAFRSTPFSSFSFFATILLLC